MKDTMTDLLTRRSVRSYLSDMVDEKTLDEILEAGKYAPTGRNFQSPIMIAVTDRNLRDRIAKINASVMGSLNDPFYGAPCVIIVLADRSKAPTTYVYDGSLVMGNLLLAAHAKGLGACWIHRAKETFETEEGKKILSELGITGDYVGIGNCILGYPDGPLPETKPRKENYIYKV